MTFKYDDVSLMDFNRFDELHDIGYERTMELMDSIKNRIPRRMDYRLLEKERMAFKKKCLNSVSAISSYTEQTTSRKIHP